MPRPSRAEQLKYGAEGAMREEGMPRQTLQAAPLDLLMSRAHYRRSQRLYSTFQQYKHLNNVLNSHRGLRPLQQDAFCAHMPARGPAAAPCRPAPARWAAMPDADADVEGGRGLRQWWALHDERQA